MLKAVLLMANSFALVMTTTNSKENANAITKALLEKKLAACIQIQPIESHYVWKGEIQQDQEFLLLIKSKATLYKKIENCILQQHAYETPEIIQVPIEKGSNPYLNWITQVTS